MGTTLRYKGPFDAMEVPEAGIVAERLKPVEVDTELAKRLLMQEDNWERPPAPRPKRSRKRPPAKKPAASDTASITPATPPEPESAQPAAITKEGE